MALTLLKTATKVGLGVGAVYVTLDQGVWSTTNQGSKALDRVRTKVLPAANDYMNQQVPSANEFSVRAAEGWNYGVTKAFEGLSSAPSKMGEYSHYAIDELKKSLK